jgi:hypothetical protein
VVMVTLTTGIMFLLFSCMHYWMWGILQQWSTCAPTAYEVVWNCWKFEQDWFTGWYHTRHSMHYTHWRSVVLPHLSSIPFWLTHQFFQIVYFFGGGGSPSVYWKFPSFHSKVTKLFNIYIISQVFKYTTDLFNWFVIRFFFCFCIL